MAIMTPPNYQELYEKEREQSARFAGELMSLKLQLRDDFAMSALQGILALGGSRFVNIGIVNEAEMFAKKAYILADAMIRARVTD